MAKYRLELVKRRKWGGFVKYPNCGTTLVPGVSRTGHYTTGLSEADVERLSAATGMSKQALLPPTGSDDKIGSYWRNFAVKVTTKGVDIDTEDPFGELLYLFCKSSSYVADGTDNITNGHDCVLLDVDKESVIKNQKNRTKRKAMLALNEMSIDHMRNALRVIGVSVRGLTDEMVEARLGDEIERNPDRFISMWVDNENKDTIIFIEKGLAQNQLRVKDGIYYYGTDKIGNSLDAAVKWAKDPKNKIVVDAINREINKKATI